MHLRRFMAAPQKRDRSAQNPSEMRYISPGPGVCLPSRGFLRSSDYSETELLEWYLGLAKAASLGDAVTLGCHVTQGFAVDARRGRAVFRVSMRAGAASCVDGGVGGNASIDRAIREVTSTPSTRPQFSLSLSEHLTNVKERTGASHR